MHTLLVDRTLSRRIPLLQRPLYNIINSYIHSNCSNSDLIRNHSSSDLPHSSSDLPHSSSDLLHSSSSNTPQDGESPILYNKRLLYSNSNNNVLQCSNNNVLQCSNLVYNLVPNWCYRKKLVRHWPRPFGQRFDLRRAMWTQSP
jgi:hypothetical protein